MNSEEIIHHFNLSEHPEGGYFKETYRSKGEILSKDLGENFEGNRNYCTSIYFLLTSDKFSAFHKISQDEIWHFYTGTTLKLHLISPEGNYSFILILQMAKFHNLRFLLIIILEQKLLKKILFLLWVVQFLLVSILEILCCQVVMNYQKNSQNIHKLLRN